MCFGSRVLFDSEQIDFDQFVSFRTIQNVPKGQTDGQPYSRSKCNIFMSEYNIYIGT